MMRFDLADGFPAITTKRLAFKTAIGEMIGLFRAITFGSAHPSH
jgi:thymidylate synthase